MTHAGELLCGNDGSRARLPSRSDRTPDHRTGWVFLDTGRRPFLRGMLKNKGETQLVEGALPEAQAGRCPVWRLICLVRGSGRFKHDARCHLGGRVTPHPGTPLSQGSWVNTTPTHGPR